MTDDRGREPVAQASDESARLARLRQGDEDAYEELVREHAGRLLAVTRRYLRDESDARDAVQEAFFSAFKALGTFQGEARISTWLHRIAVNAALMKIRSRQRKPETPIEELLPTFLEDGQHAQQVQAWEHQADRELERKETRQVVRSCIDKLPEDYRNVLLLRDIEELDTSEAAKMLGITTNAVKIRLHRARQALRGLLAPHLATIGP